MKVILSKNKKSLFLNFGRYQKQTQHILVIISITISIIAIKFRKFKRIIYQFYSREAIYTFYKQKTENVLDNSYLLMLL